MTSQRRISRSLVAILLFSLIETFAIVKIPMAEAATSTSGPCSIDTTGTGSFSLTDSTATDGTCIIRVTSGTLGFTLPSLTFSIRTLVVGGGGGGGFGGNGGGGGAGAAIWSTSGLTVTSGTSFSATIGGGGTSGYNANSAYWTKGGIGTDSSLTIGSTTYVASGGGGGGAYGTGADRGGSGGGMAINGTGVAGAAFNLDYAGWTESSNAGSAATGVGGGGGGGANGVPGGVVGTASSNGGIGLDWFGYKVGGGGSGWSGGNSTVARPYGGGSPRDSAGYNCNNVCDGIANTGGGGGGGGAGGSGVVIIKFVPAIGQGVIASSGPIVIGRSRTLTFTRTTAASTGITPNYQWQEKVAGSSVWSDVTTGSGGNTTTYVTPVATVANSGNSYRMVVTDIQSTQLISSGTFTEAPAATLPNTEIDYSLELNGSSQYASKADDAAFDLSGSFSLEAWVYPTSVTGTSMILNKENAYEIFIKDGVYGIAATTNGTNWSYAINNIPAVPNEWHHIAYVRSSGQVNYTAYLDGVSAYVGAADALGTSNLFNSTGDFSIGARSSVTTQRFTGKIDNVAGFNTARTQAQVLADMNGYIDANTSGLQYYYDFNEGSGSTVYNHDVSGTSATDLAITGAATYSDVKSVDNSTAYTKVSFPRTYITPVGGWKSPAMRITYNALLVGGGGAGGARVSTGAGGGGGAGGMIDSSYKTLDTSTVVTVKVGQGGLGEFTGTMSTIAPGDNGGSSLLVAGSTTLLAIGGGGGAGGYDSDSTSYAGKSGGSGGGASGSSVSGNAGGAALQGSGSGYTGYGNAGGANPGCPSYRQAGGGGGAGGKGATIASCTTAASGNGGVGKTSAVTGVTYAGGGGGGTSGDGGVTAGAGGTGGGATGGTWKTITASVGTINLGNSATPNTGGGGGGTGIPTGITQGGAGAAGIIVIKYLSVALPTYTDPSNDTTTAGLTYTFTVTGSAPSPFVRTYKWQSSTDTGTTWSDITTGTGYTTASYTTPILETTTSGLQYQYRVMVIDTDNGTVLSDISTAAYLIINARLVLNGSYTVMKYGTTHTDTFTVPADSGTGNKIIRRTSTAKSLITWDTSTANTAAVTVGVKLPAGTYYDTITVTDEKYVTSNFPITITVLKADTVTVTAADRNDTYTASSLTYIDSYTVLGLVAGDTISAVTYTYTGSANDGTLFSNSVRPAIAGTYLIKPNFTIPSAANYESVTVTSGTLAINRKLRSVTATTKPTTLKYGETSTVIASASDGVGDGTLSYASTTASLCSFTDSVIKAIEASGNCQFTASISRGVNYETSTSTLYTATLSQADTITVTVESLTALTYTGSNTIVSPTIRVTGLVHTDTTTSTSASFTYKTATGVGSFSTLKPINSDTYTVRADSLTVTSGLLSRYKAITYIDGTLRINRAQQSPLIFAQYQYLAGAAYKAVAYGGSGTGAYTFAISSGNATGCAITGETVSATSEGSCLLTIIRAQDQNYETKTASALIYFLNWSALNPTPPIASGSTIAIAGEISVVRDPNAAPTISSLSTYSAQAGSTQIVINGSGFDHTNLAGITVKFWRNQVASGFTVNAGDSQITVTVPAGATTGKVTVTTPNGIAVSEQPITVG